MTGVTIDAMTINCPHCEAATPWRTLGQSTGCYRCPRCGKRFKWKVKGLVRKSGICD